MNKRGNRLHDAFSTLPDLETIPEALAGTIFHALPVESGEGQPVAKQVPSTLKIVGLDHPGPVLLNFSPDVHLVRDEHGNAAGECFRNHNAKILLVRGQHEY